MRGKIPQGQAGRSRTSFRKTHDLNELLNQVITIEPSWQKLSKELDSLNKYSITFRYPGDSADKAEAKDAVRDCRKVRRVIRTAFGLPV